MNINTPKSLGALTADQELHFIELPPQPLRIYVEPRPWRVDRDGMPLKEAFEVMRLSVGTVIMPGVAVCYRDELIFTVNGPEPLIVGGKL